MSSDPTTAEDIENMTEEELLSAFKRNKETRFYQKPLPQVNDLVMVKVMRVADTAAYVQLCEYSGIEGMILFSEVSTRRIRSMLKEIRAGQFAVCVVLRVEPVKGYIDLSRRRVQAADRNLFVQTYAKSKLVQSTLRHLSGQHNVPMEELCSKVSWPLYKQYGHAIDAFKAYINTRNVGIFKELEIEDGVKKDMYLIIEKKLTPQAMKLKAKIEVSCFEEAGIEAVKSSLLAGLEGNDELLKKHAEAAALSAKEEKETAATAKESKPAENQGNNKKGDKNSKSTEKEAMGIISIKVVAPPHYDVTTTSLGKEAGVTRINESLQKIEAKIKELGGNFVLKSKPEVVAGDGGHDDIMADDVASGDEDESESGSDDGDGEDETMGKADFESHFKK